MKKSVVCEKMRRGEVILLAKQNFFNPNLSELMGYAGFDCLWLCNEHQAADPSLLENLARTAKITGTDILVRTAAGDYTDLIRPLEFGAQGIMVPHIRSAEQAARIARETRFHPVGLRGMDCVNHDADQGMASMAQYIEFANANTFVVVQIEDPDALEEAEKIAAVPGVDVIFLGPMDYSQAIGRPGDVRSPEVFDALRRCAEACAAHGKYCGSVGFGDPGYIEELIGIGVRFIGGPSDYGMMRAALAQEVERYRRLGFGFRRYDAETGRMESA